MIVVFFSFQSFSQISNKYNSLFLVLQSCLSLSEPPGYVCLTKKTLSNPTVAVLMFLTLFQMISNGNNNNGNGCKSMYLPFLVCCLICNRYQMVAGSAYRAKSFLNT